MARGYIPAPVRGSLHVGPDAPTAKPNLAWLDIKTGTLFRFDERMDQWLPYSVGSPAWGGEYGAITVGDAIARQTYALALGVAAEAAEYSSIAIGHDVTANGSSSIAIGDGAEAANSQDTIAIGRSARAGTTDDNSARSIAIGADAAADNYGAIAIGENARGAAMNATAVGPSTSAGNTCTAVGYSARAGATGGTATFERSTAVGFVAHVDADDGTAVGSGASVTAASGLALGRSAAVTSGGSDGVALGVAAESNHPRSLALGLSASTTAADQTVIATDELVLRPSSGLLGTPETPGASSSVVLYSPNGSLWRLTVDDTGALATSPVA